MCIFDIFFSRKYAESKYFRTFKISSAFMLFVKLDSRNIFSRILSSEIILLENMIINTLYK